MWRSQARSGQMDMHRLVVSTPLPQDVGERAIRQFNARLAPEGDVPLDKVLELLWAERPLALLSTTRLALDQQAVARLPPGLKIIATCSAGYDHIDIAAAQRRGLVV